MQWERLGWVIRHPRHTAPCWACMPITESGAAGITAGEREEEEEEEDCPCPLRQH